eukprot:851846_1
MDTETKFKTTIAFAMPMICALPAAYIAFTIRDTNAKIRFTTGFISTGLYLNLKAFGVMGASVASQIVAEKMAPQTLQDSIVWKATWLGALHVSMDCTLWWIREHALVASIPFFCG